MYKTVQKVLVKGLRIKKSKVYTLGVLYEILER